jgi:predicted negative regulator of RcsB-dependent stress response
LPELAGRPYDAAIAAADRELGRLIEGVRKRRRDAVVAVIGDHGEALGSHGEPRHGYFIYTATTRIPLVVAIPGRAARGVRVATSVRSVDVMPTLLDVAGLEAPAGLDGRSLVPLMLGRSHEPPGPVVVENMATALRYGASPLFALRRRPYLYVRAPAPELYDVTQDPGESDDASPRLPQVLADMDGELRRAMPSLPAIAGTIDPKSGVRLFQRYLDALRAHSSGRTAEAVTTYRAVLAEQPGFAIARRRLSEALVSLERYGEAEPVLAELIARGEADETTSLNLGLIRYRAKEPERALAVLRDGLQKWPRSAALRHRAGRVLMELGRPAEAVLELTESARLDPRYDDAPLALGEALESLGRKDEARAAYQAAARTSPDSDNGRRAAQALGRMAGTGASAP